MHQEKGEADKEKCWGGNILTPVLPSTQKGREKGASVESRERMTKKHTTKTTKVLSGGPGQNPTKLERSGDHKSREKKHNEAPKY